MAQLESSSAKKNDPVVSLEPPRRKFTIELLVGLFTLVGVVCMGILAVGLGNERIFGGGMSEIQAEFDNISGLKKGASVEIAGVPIGEVADILLDDPKALVICRLHNGVRIRDDDILSIRTKGIIGDRYIKVSRGGSDTYIPEGGKTTETESVVDIEDIIGKIVHSITGEKKEEGSK
jgi:phospholipid/cholesterol/gamma-HCH transport system substrate-binding protein